MLKEQELLNEYKKYDYLNQQSEKPLIKIFVSYIKPSFLFKSEILTPIHLGRAVEREPSKSGNVTDDDIEWLHENCIGDDDFEGNISNINRRLGFYTGTYWAWKNYEKLGNPKYFGSFGYRRLFVPNYLKDIDNYDIVLPIQKRLNKTIRQEMINCHGELFYNSMIDIIKQTYPEELDDVLQYFERTSGYYAELYVLKKELFFEYCEWIYKIINNFIKLYSNNLTVNEKEIINLEFVLAKFLDEEIINCNKDEKRDLAFIVERLTGYYMYKQTLTKKYKEVPVYETYITIGKYSVDECKQKILNKIRQNVVNTMRRNNNA